MGFERTNRLFLDLKFENWRIGILEIPINRSIDWSELATNWLDNVYRRLTMVTLNWLTQQ
jgi:hypothetical protein